MYTRQNLALSLVLAISMVSISYGVGGDMGAATEPWTDGSAAYPYLIEDLTDFDVFADPCNSATYWSSGVYTKLTCDPNLTGRPYTTAVIAPDTDDTNYSFDGILFEGVFDGNGHIISNLTIDTVGAGNDYLGLFGRIEGSGAQVKNMSIENINITGGTYSGYLGGLCGVNGYNSTITNCYATGLVTGGNNSLYLGGLCGENWHGTITNCYATGSITGDDRLGGLCGYNNDGTITNCYAAGLVTGGDDSRYLGGLCGSNSGTITNCYAAGSVTGGYYSRYLGGLCGYNGGGTITNCYATGSVTGGDDSCYLGGLCGYNWYGTITNCYAAGSATGGDDSDYLGGLCGDNWYGTITNCYATGLVTGGDDSRYLGGLCGRNWYGTITNCYATGSVTGSGSLGGGLCGKNGQGMITNCYATGSVTGNNYLGGLCGSNDGGTITNCYAAGSLTGNDYLGGLCGYSYGSTITNCFWDVETGGTDNGIGTPKTTAEMQTQSTFVDAGWDFTDESANGTNQIWQMPTGSGYPVLSSFNGYTPVLLSGNGTEADPYLINDAAQLGAIYHYNSNACFRLQSDIDLAGIQWSTAIMPVFGGCFDGNGYVIYNLNIEGGGYLGLCGKILGSSAEVKNLGIENINITSGTDFDYLGGLCGYSWYGTITNCYAAGLVIGGDDSRYLGGLCGWNEGGTITNCYATGSVTGGDDSCYLGGLCGRNYDSTITNCYATGSVIGGDNSGYLGGLCGENGYNGTITNCYAVGSVTGGADSFALGGLCGVNNPYGAISNCFWDTQTSGMSVSDGGTGKTTAEMQTESTFTDANWDFTVVPVWRMPFEAIGYPMLGWQKDIPGDFTGRYGVDMVDFAVLSNAWLSVNTPTANWNEHCDLNANGVIDPGDLKIFAENWLCK